MKGLYLIASVAKETVAIEASVIESVVRVGEIIAVPRTDPIVAGLYALRSRVLTMIDCQVAVTGKPMAVGKSDLAIVATLGASQFGFLVDSVLDVVKADTGLVHGLPCNSGPWAHLVSGFVELDGKAIMVLDLGRLLSRDMPSMAA
jgi:purine-binding chemotaxis protein CheW